AVGADAGIAVGAPGAAERLLRFQRHERRSRALRGEVIGGSDAGDAGAGNQHVEMLGGAGRRLVDLRLNVHLPCLFDCRVLKAKRQNSRFWRRMSLENYTSRRLRKASRSNRCTSCSFLSSAPCSGGISLRGSRSLSISGVMSSLSSSLSQSSSSEVEGFFFRPGTSRTSKKMRSASSTRRFLMPAKCTSTILPMVSASGNLM